MTAIDVHNWNYGAQDLRSKIAQVFKRNKGLLGAGVQRSVTAKSPTGKIEHVITVIEVLPTGTSRNSDLIDYGRVCFRCEILTLDTVLERLSGLEARQFIVGQDTFQFEMNFGFSDHLEHSNNDYGIWPGTVFDIAATYSQLPTGPLWHANLPSHDSVFAAIRDFLCLKRFNDFSDARLGHTLIYIPNLNGRLQALALSSRELTVSTLGALPPEQLILEVLYSKNERKQRFKGILSGTTEKVILDFVPSELRVLLFSASGDLLDFHEETILYSNGCNAVLPKSKPVLVTPLQAGGFAGSFGIDDDAEIADSIAVSGESEATTLNSLPKKDQLLAHIHSLVEKTCIFSVLVIDLDKFKEVNDTKGHLEGDACLERVVEVLGNVIAQKGMLYRWGGDEFAVVLPNFDRAEAEATAERIRSSVVRGQPGGDIHVTTSIGVAATEEAMETSAEDLLRTADEAMYASKKGGRNRVTVLRPKTRTSDLAASATAT
jgi:diguanylate cyclase (GGDEF)-like protein